MATEAEAKPATQTATAHHPMADPAPLGLFGFATTTLVLSAANSNFDGVHGGAALGLALAFGGLAQLLAGMWEFKNGNTFGAVAFSSYGAFWISFWALSTVGANSPVGADGSHNGIGWYLLGWTIVTGLLMLGTLRLNMGLLAVFLLLFITFLLLAIGEFNFVAGQTPSPIAGYFGIATAIAAYYVGVAGVLKAVGGFKLPVGGPLMKG